MPSLEVVQARYKAAGRELRAARAEMQFCRSTGEDAPYLDRWEDALREVMASQLALMWHGSAA
jgi:hypothetical protein